MYNPDIRMYGQEKALHLFSGWVFWLWTVPTAFMTLWTLLAYLGRFCLGRNLLGAFAVLLYLHPGHMTLLAFGHENVEKSFGGFVMLLVLGAIPVFNLLLPFACILFFWFAAYAARFK